jgi:hypothetical protein
LKIAGIIIITMPKKIVQDVLPPDKKTIRRIPLPERKKQAPAIPEKESTEPEAPHMPPPTRPPRSYQPETGYEGERKSRIGLWIIAAISVIVLAFAASMLFSSAKLVITPKQQKVEVNGTFTAKKETAGDELKYELMTITREAAKNVDASEEKQVETKATGKIIVYNNYNTSPQRLIKNTRFENAKGQIYRITDSVTVPGKKTENGTVVPGSVEATVIADEAGEAYNMKLTDLTGDFKIPGFKGDPRYNGFFARLKSDATGGFKGAQKVVDDKTLAATRTALQQELKEQILKDAHSQKPDGYVLFDTAYAFEFEQAGITGVSSETAKVTERATLYAIILNSTQLGNEIIKGKNLPKIDYTILDLQDLQFSIKTKDWGFKDQKPLSFGLVGTVRAVADIDDVNLKNDLADKTSKEVNAVLSKYPGIETAEIVLRPFWRRTFPAKSEDIKIEEVVRQ